MMKLGTVITYLKKIQVVYKSCDKPPEFCWNQYFFYWKSATFVISWNTDTDCIFSYNFWFFNFEYLKIVLINMVVILMMSAKLAALGLLKIKVFWYKVHDVIVFVHDVTNKFLSFDSNHTVDVVMWPKFVNSSIYMKEVIITLILYGFDQKHQFFW